ncbi:hypothetical protein AGOR_G00224950 [Albula goreensis]|uniref:Ig-like domain-containing protein n=1 Tax=Albula goreensis TaxID=1534307 RepID=A0A8T3CMB7_9TELE|nr:hypothetical protein AGOR_G00224950 [Albula goreensis]
MSAPLRLTMEMMRSEQFLSVLFLLSPSVYTYYIAECPLVIQPDTVVVRFGDPASANCIVSEDHMGIGWEASEGSVDMEQDVQFIPWSLEHLTDWEIQPKCYGNFMISPHCEKELKVIVYKTPDSVSISAVNHTDPMLEGEQYQLQCEVENIAPVQNLTVKCADDGAQYSCVAELELGPEGPEPHPADTSEPLTITVHYSPSFVGPLEEQREVIEGEEGSLLNCHANGNPPPEYSWTSPLGQEEKSSPELKISTSLSPGTHTYTCSASNDLGSKTKKFTVEVIATGGPIVLWSVIGVGILVAVVLIVGYIFLKSRAHGNSII